MKQREETVRRWFDMWRRAEDGGILDIFAEDAVYIESWGPEYHGAGEIKRWFAEWNTRGKVLQWDIRQMLHSGGQTLVEWYFRDEMWDGTTEAFEGVSLIQWTSQGKISRLQEFGCSVERYDPYENGDAPHFRGEKPLWL